MGRAPLAMAAFLFAVACSDRDPPAYLRNRETREVAGSCGLHEDAVVIDPFQSNDRLTLAIPKSLADRRPQAWRCVQALAGRYGFNASLEANFE